MRRIVRHVQKITLKNIETLTDDYADMFGYIIHMQDMFKWLNNKNFLEIEKRWIVKLNVLVYTIFVEEYI